MSDNMSEAICLYNFHTHIADTNVMQHIRYTCQIQISGTMSYSQMQNSMVIVCVYWARWCPQLLSHSLLMGKTKAAPDLSFSSCFVQPLASTWTHGLGVTRRAALASCAQPCDAPCVPWAEVALSYSVQRTDNEERKGTDVGCGCLPWWERIKDSKPQGFGFHQLRAKRWWGRV